MAGSWNQPGLNDYNAYLQALYQCNERSGPPFDCVGNWPLSMAGPPYASIEYMRPGKSLYAIWISKVYENYISFMGPSRSWLDDVFSLSFWIKIANFNGNYVFLFVNGPSIWIAADRIAWIPGSGGGQEARVYYGFTPGVWYHVLTTRQADGKRRFYINAGYCENDLDGVDTNSYATRSIYWGSMSCELDQVVWWADVALADTEAVLLYNSGTGAEWDDPGYAVTAATRVRHAIRPIPAARTRFIGGRFLPAHAGPEDEAPAWTKRPRLVASRTLEHPSEIKRIGHPTLIGGPEPEQSPLFMTGRQIVGRRDAHESGSERIGHAGIIGGPEPEVVPLMLRTVKIESEPQRHESRVLLTGWLQCAGPEPEYDAVFVRPRMHTSRPVSHEPRSRRHGPPLIEFLRRYGDARGLYRVFNTAEFRFYRSQVGPPVETDTPFATSPTLPATPDAEWADGTWYVSVSWFDGVLDSGFLPFGPNGETYLVLEIVDGAAVRNRPNGPLNLTLEQTAGGIVRVRGLYGQSGAERATQWAIAWTDDESEPPADDPDATPSVGRSGLAVLNHELPPQADGTMVKVLVQVRRNDGTGLNPDWRYSAASPPLSLMVDAQGTTEALAADRWAGTPPEE